MLGRNGEKRKEFLTKLRVTRLSTSTNYFDAEISSQKTTSNDFEFGSLKSYDDSFGQAFERERIYLFYHLLGTGNSAP